ncbi:hypothetical protein [uncultured Flavonifractor sp.]|uniref:hypothetical protein n=1 Tax=uncultured Flavonifractor sp. TaxID=1193534 RepID=UPI00174C1B0E|nr:hypothetical protein [uncultured Flavonifractor sp.]
MGNPKQVTIYTWKYDNGTRGYAVKQENTEDCLNPKVCVSKREIRKCRKEYKKQSPDLEVKREKVVYLAGLPCIKYRYKDIERESSEKNGVHAMLCLLNSCGATPDAKREMLRLVASVLAGYCARVSSEHYMNYLSQLHRRAPIITVKQAPYAGEVLEYVIRSLALDTTETELLRLNSAGRTIKCRYAPVLPKKADDEKITDRAFSKLEGSKKRMLPQYRDTTLMVYGWFLRGGEGRQLQLMNRWVSMVIYGASRKQVVTTPVEIEGKDLAKSDCRWSKADIRLSVIRFAHYVFRKSNQEKRWRTMLQTEFSRYDAMIDSHNQNSTEKIKVAERYHISMQLLALHLFLKAGVNADDLEKSQATEIEKEWYTILLPGCEMSGISDFGGQDEMDEDRDAKVRELFEDTLEKILESGFPDKFYIYKEDKKSDMWGDIGPFSGKDSKQDMCIRFPKTKFEELLDRFAGDRGGKWLYEKVQKLDLNYIYFLKKIRVNATESNSSGVVLQIDEMTFLPQELHSKLVAAGQCAIDNKKRNS